MGLWIALYLIFHLLTNSRAALFFGDYGSGFIREVNWIHDLPYLPVLEVIVIALPFLFHALWGIRYAVKAKVNSVPGSGKKPHLKYGANHAYTWQRITAWILLIGIIWHVVEFRFIHYPKEVKGGYAVEVSMDKGLPGVAKRLDAKIEGSGRQVTVVSKSFGEATLFNVRNVFKSWTLMSLYTVFVISAVYHGFRGLWSFCIVWGLTLTQRSQKMMKWISILLMVVIGFLGLAAVWLTYLVTLR